MNKIKFKIGEFSKLNRVTVKTLRHYEKIGLLVPYLVDEWTGYRYYNVTQFHKMGHILYLKQLGFSLDDIKDLFEDGREQPTKEMIQKKLTEYRLEEQQLHWRLKELGDLEKQLKKQTNMEKVVVKSLPAIIVASHRRVISGYAELFNLCPNIIGPEMQRLGCVCAQPEYCYTIDHNRAYRETNIDIEYCEAVTEKKADTALLKFKQIAEVPMALCMNHIGVYETLPQTFAKLFEYAEKNGYTLIDNPRFCYIDGIWNKESEAGWLTEIQMPVTKK